MRRRRYREYFLLIVAAAVMFLLAGCRNGEKIKEDICGLVEKNYDVIAEACENKDEDALYAIDGIETVYVVDGYVLIYCKGAGIAPSSQYYGFYYSEENLPVAVFGGEILCGTADLTEQGNGYRYLDSGYNEFYTEHIKGNIYFYSASF